MAIFENVLLALESLKMNKLRSVLTMLGIIIGIGSVIAISTVGSSLTGYVSDSMTSLGASSINVTLTQKSSDDESESENSDNKDVLKNGVLLWMISIAQSPSQSQNAPPATMTAANPTTQSQNRRPNALKSRLARASTIFGVIA